MQGKNKRNGNRRSSSSREKCGIDVREVGCAYGNDSEPINPDRVTIEMTTFDDGLVIAYKNIALYFDMTKIESVRKLVQELVNSFEFATENDRT